MSKLADRIKAKQKALKETKDSSAADVLTQKAEARKIIAAKKEAIDKQSSTLADRLKKKQEAKQAEIEAETDETDEALPEEERSALAEKLDELKAQYEDLISRVNLTDIIEDVTSLGSDIEELPEEVEAVRQRGYRFHAYLEGKVAVLAEKWDDVNDRIETWLEQESEDLDDEVATAKALIVKSATDTYTPVHQKIAAQLETVLETTTAAVEAAEERIKALYTRTRREVSETQSQLRKITKYLDQVEAASFDMTANEAIYMVAEAEWDDNGDKPDGFIYVTNKRMVFEQNEKTGKRFGMFGGKQTQQVLWEVDFDVIDQVVPEDRGMMGGKDMMHLKMSGGDYAELTAEIKGGIDASYWAQQVNRAVKGFIEQDSAVEPDPELIERLRNAPADCPNCGGTLPQLDAGDMQVTCEYCGTVVRI
mgnify:CR=1 FL=1